MSIIKKSIRKSLVVGGFCMMYSMVMSAQISLTLESKTTRDVIREIERASEYRFFYNEDLLGLDQEISIDASDANIQTILNEIQRQTSIRYVIKENNQIVLFTGAESGKTQQVDDSRIVKGTVVDAAGMPVIGANVMVKGTTNGTITDMDGNFSIEVGDGAVLQVSYIGFANQEIKVGNQTNLSIALKEDVEALDELVVVGFGTQKKVNLTGAIGIASGEDLKERPVKSAVYALQGLVAGLNVTVGTGLLDSSPSINIRGTGTIGDGSSAAPLVLIDGMEGDLKYINPQDIESISVLKDAAASSLYGSRAPFGVILVTTKKGEKGHTVVNYNNNFIWSAPTLRPDVMDSYTFATFINDACTNSNQAPFITEERLQRIKDYQTGKIKTVSIVDPSNPQYWANGNSFGNANVDAYDLYYKNWSFSQEHNVSARGGSDKFAFYVSMGYLDQNGLLEVADEIYRRFSPMGKIDVQLTNWLKLNYTTRFTRIENTQPRHLTSDLYADWARQNWPFLPPYDDNGYIYPRSPLLAIVEGGNTYKTTDHFYNYGKLEIEPVRNWVTNIEFGYDTKTYDGRTVTLKTYNHDVNGEPYVMRENSSVSNSWNKNYYLDLNAYTTYGISIAGVHNLKAILGLQYENNKYSTFGAGREGIIVDSLPVIDLTSGMNPDGTVALPIVNGSMNEWSTAGYFGRLNYDYKGKYLAEVNLRYDGTSRFRANKRWNWFPSFSLGWNVAKEDFWVNFSSVVNALKLRGSYGELGNQNTGSLYPTYQIMSVSSNSGAWLQNGLKTNVAYPPALISSSLSWEKIHTGDIGVDIGMFDNRLTGSFDAYIRKTLNMMGPAEELPNILGTSVPKSNNTDLKTYGFELELAWRDRLSNGFSYGIKFLLSDDQTEITKYPNATKSLSTHYTGKKLGNLWGYETLGIAKSDEEMQNHLASLPNGGQNVLGSQWTAGDIMYKDLNGDGKIDSGSYTWDDHGDMRIIGNDHPRFRFGLDLDASWKNFDIRCFFQGVAKRDFWSGAPAFWGSNQSNMWYIIGFKEHEDYFRMAPSNDLPANIDSYYPRPLLDNKNQRVQTRYLQNAAYIRLKNISIGYTFPRQITRIFFVDNMRVFFSGENLWTGTGLAKMFDPEGIDGNSSSSGVGYPIQKTISLGLSVTL